MKICVVAYATPERQHIWTVQLPDGATIADAIATARSAAGPSPIPWDGAPVGIFGDIRTRDHVPENGDRIELYRPLKEDPRQRRRERVQQTRKR